MVGVKIYNCFEVDADSEENAWEELKKLITIKETK